MTRTEPMESKEPQADNKKGTVTKAMIVKILAQTSGYNAEQAQFLVDHTLELMQLNLVAGTEIMLTGFGKFCVKHKKERVGRNPKNGEPITIAPRRVLKFHPALLFKKNVNAAISTPTP